MWIQAFNDRTKYNLYALYNQDENGDLYKCIQCTRYEHRGHKPSSITVRHRPDGTAELSEKRNHYPSCNHDKSFIDKIQKKYHRTPKSANNDLPKPKPRPSLQKPSTTKPALQTQVFSNASPEDSRKRRSARLSQNESDIDANPSVPSPPVVAKPVFIKPSSAAPSSARRSRTQAVRIPVTSQNSRVIRDDSVASNFSHLIPSYQARTNANPSPLSRPIAAFSKANPVVIPLKPIDLGPFPTNARISTPPQPHIPTPPLLHQNGTSSVDLANIPFLQPKTLAYNESICHCIPSSHNLREMSALLGLEYKSQSQAFWHSTYIINEITGRAKASITQNITMQRNLGFQAISMFLTSSEESTFKIQESIKQYIFTNLQNLVAKNNVSYNHLMQTALCSYQLENVHLWVLTKIMNVRIVVFSSEGVQVFGDAFDDSLPSILLKKNNGEYLPVLSVQK
uniref:Uncharacterized protein n=1 Tax=Panagrolaimus davidi TaxID=227884 RepID=A0A914PXU0_9BILA